MNEERHQTTRSMLAIFAIQSAIEQELTVRDHKLISGSGSDPKVVTDVIRRNFDHRSKLRSAVYMLCDQETEVGFSANGMAANWQFYC